MSDPNQPRPEQPPVPPPIPVARLAYQARTPLPPIPNFGRKLFGGILIGCALSCLMWIPPVAIKGADVLIWLSLLFLVAKVIVAIILACFRNQRPWGIGLLISLPIGALIFFGACAAAMSGSSFH